jgi:hypothetical protein
MYLTNEVFILRGLGLLIFVALIILVAKNYKSVLKIIKPPSKNEKGFTLIKLMIIIALVCLMFVACAQTPKKVFTPLEMQTQNQFDVDKDYCNNKALEATIGDFKYHERIEIWKKVFVGCMEIKGYELDRT